MQDISFVSLLYYYCLMHVVVSLDLHSLCMKPIIKNVFIFYKKKKD